MIWINPGSSRYARKSPESARFTAEDLASQIAQEARKQLVAGAFRRRLPIVIFLRPCVHRLAVLLLEVLALLLRALLAVRGAVIAVAALLLAVLATAVTAISVASVIAVPVAVAATVTVAVALLLAATLPAMFLALVALRLMPLRRRL
ncbi:MAG TPA: hypothetical protein VJQ51_07655 [Burkholderiales bacterium]|nr:hypothetical protein [Burkholderiales bacterium]